MLDKLTEEDWLKAIIYMHNAFILSICTLSDGALDTWPMYIAQAN